MICPKCRQELFRVNNSYKCQNSHTYDIAKENYLNLLLSQPNAGDNKDLVISRVNFLSKCYYDPFVNHLISCIKDYNGTTLLDCGCGTGYYTSRLAAYFTCFGIDISKYAIRYASKNDKLSTYIVASSKLIPFKNNSFDFILYNFAPIFIDEAKRVLKDNGLICICSKGKNHLYELKEKIYSEPYVNEEKTIMTDLILKRKENITFKINLNDEDFHNLILMTPYAYKTNRKDYLDNRIKDTIEVTCDFIISFYQK